MGTRSISCLFVLIFLVSSVWATGTPSSCTVGQAACVSSCWTACPPSPCPGSTAHCSASAYSKGQCAVAYGSAVGQGGYATASCHARTGSRSGGCYRRPRCKGISVGACLSVNIGTGCRQHVSTNLCANIQAQSCARRRCRILPVQNTMTHVSSSAIIALSQRRGCF